MAPSGTRGMRLLWGFHMSDSVLAYHAMPNLKELDVRLDTVPSVGDRIEILGFDLLVKEVLHRVTPETPETDAVHLIDIYVVPV